MGLISNYPKATNSQEYKTWRFYLNSVLGNELLNVDPIGWDEIGLTLERDDVYHGIFRTYTAELEFVDNGYDILKQLFDTYGVLAQCSLSVYKRNPVTRNDALVFSSKIDFSEYTELTTSKKSISVTLLDSTFQEKLKNRENIDIPYDRAEDLDGNVMPVGTYETVSVLGREFGSQTTTSIWQDVDPGDNTNEYDLGTGVNASYIMATYYENLEILPNYQNPIKATYAGRNATIDDCFYYSDITSAEMELIINIALNSTSNTNNKFSLEKITFDRDGNYDSREFLVEQTFGSIIELKKNISTSLSPYQGLLMSLTIFGGVTSATITVQEGFDLSIREVSTFNPVTRNVILPHEAFSQVCHAITGESDSFRSNYFGRTDIGYDEDGAGAYIGLMKGMLLRGYPIGYIEEPPKDQELSQRVSQVTFKFKELFESYSKLKNLGAEMLLEDGKYIIQVEPLDDLYSYEIGAVLTRSDIKKNTFQRRFEIDNVYSSVQAGYITQKEDLLGGLEEYSSMINHSSKLSEVVQNELNLVPVYIGASVPFEKTRRKPFEITSTEETTYDNSMFFFEMLKEEGVLVQRNEQGFSEINGLDGLDTKLNLGLTPVQILLANGDKLGIGLTPYPTSKIKFNSSAKTTDLSFKYTGETSLIYENGDKVVGSLENTRFTGNIISVESSVSLEDFTEHRLNPNKIIQVWSEIDNKYVYGWRKKESSEVVDGEGNWEIIEAHPNDIGTVTVLQVNDDLLQLDDDSLLQVT